MRRFILLIRMVVSYIKLLGNITITRDHDVMVASYSRFSRFGV